MASQPVTLTKWNNGGIADSKWSGTPDSLYRMVGLDPHSEPAVLKAEQKLTNINITIPNKINFLILPPQLKYVLFQHLPFS